MRRTFYTRTTALCLGVLLGLSAPRTAHAQGPKTATTLGSNGGSVSPADSGASGLGAKNVAVGSDIGSPGNAPATSLSDRSAGATATSESDEPSQILHLAPYAFGLFLLLAGALYWGVFRKPTTVAGEEAAEEEATENREVEIGSR